MSSSLKDAKKLSMPRLEGSVSQDVGTARALPQGANQPGASEEVKPMQSGHSEGGRGWLCDPGHIINQGPGRKEMGVLKGKRKRV